MSSQVPSATNTPSTPVVTTCDRTSITTTGPTAGGASFCFNDVKNELVVVHSDLPNGEPLYYRGEQVGTSSDFVMFNGKRVIKEVAPYLKAMIDAAAEVGVNLTVSSAFRTSRKQQELYGIYLSGGNLAAQPNGSNHQNGIAIDLNVHQAGGRYEWMVKNAWKYGFIRTVPRERWHWEYWGDWAGQEKPEWAKHRKWGPNGHEPKAMFSKVPRVHTCGESNTGGGSRVIRRANWLNNKQPAIAPDHSDGITAGSNNSWIGFGDEHLPDKFDDEDPGWNRL